jgi:hypothetical protein
MDAQRLVRTMGGMAQEGQTGVSAGSGHGRLRLPGSFGSSAVQRVSGLGTGGRGHMPAAGGVLPRSAGRRASPAALLAANELKIRAETGYLAHVKRQGGRSGRGRVARRVRYPQPTIHSAVAPPGRLAAPVAGISFDRGYFALCRGGVGGILVTTARKAPHTNREGAHMGTAPK